MADDIYVRTDEENHFCSHWVLQEPLTSPTLLKRNELATIFFFCLALSGLYGLYIFQRIGRIAQESKPLNFRV